jgi:hypothetical protein
MFGDQCPYHVVIFAHIMLLVIVEDVFLLQSLAVVTLGDKQMAQRVDNLVDEEEFKRFYLQVCLP